MNSILEFYLTVLTTKYSTELSLSIINLLNIELALSLIHSVVAIVRAALPLVSVNWRSKCGLGGEGSILVHKCEWDNSLCTALTHNSEGVSATTFVRVKQHVRDLLLFRWCICNFVMQNCEM